jgi:hypothetical protein
MITVLTFLVFLGYAPSDILVAYVIALVIDFFLYSRIGARIARNNP